MTIKKMLYAATAYILASTLVTALVATPSSALIQGQLSSNTPMQVYSGSLHDGLEDYIANYSPVGDSRGNYYTFAATEDRTDLIKLDQTGKYIKTLPAPNNMTLSPYTIGIDSHDNIYVTARVGNDHYNNVLLRYSNDAVNLTIPDLNSITNGGETLGEATSIAADDSGNIYISSASLLAKFKSDGTLVTTIPPLTYGADRLWPYAVAVGPDGSLYALLVYENNPTSASFVAQIDEDGTILKKFDNGNTFSTGIGITADKDGNVYALGITNFDNGPTECMGLEFGVRKYRPDGSYVGNLNTSPEASKGPVCPIYGVSASSASIGMDTNGDILLGSGDFSSNQPGGARIVKYSYPKNQASFTQNSHTTTASLTVSGDATIANATNNTPADINAPMDGNNQYPLGFVRFNANVNHTNPVQIELLFATDLQPNQVVARKYNSVTKQYSDVPGAVIATSQLNGKPALKLSYSVRDGGSLDEDATVNGTIIDPVGLATTQTSTMQALLTPNTGYVQIQTTHPYIVSTITLISVLVATPLVTTYIRKRHRKIQF